MLFSKLFISILHRNHNNYFNTLKQKISQKLFTTFKKYVMYATHRAFSATGATTFCIYIPKFQYHKSGS